MYPIRDAHYDEPPSSTGGKIDGNGRSAEAELAKLGTLPAADETVVDDVRCNGMKGSGRKKGHASVGSMIR